jgi:putative PIN family toxin of toxin-antitoxin system
MIRFAPDTNVVVSATIAREGAPGRVLRAWLDGKVELATSRALLRELERVLQRPRIREYQKLAPDEVSRLVELIAAAAVITPGRRPVRLIHDDPSDDFVLSAALETDADYVVTGDRHLLALGSYRGTRIVQPAEFLMLLEAE